MEKLNHINLTGAPVGLAQLQQIQISMSVSVSVVQSYPS